MTANQIAYAQNIEQGRHNVASEEEINRHNVESEKLQQAANNLMAEQLAYQDRWNSEKNRIQEEYNKAYLEYQNAALDKKYEIETRLNELSAEKNKLQEDYNTKMYEIQTAGNALKHEQNVEINRHNQAMETMEYWFDTKRLEYERSSVESAVAFNAAKMQDLIAQRNLQEQSNLINYATNQMRLQQELDIWNAKASFMNAELISNNLLGGLKTGFSIFRPFDWR